MLIRSDSVPLQTKSYSGNRTNHIHRKGSYSCSIRNPHQRNLIANFERTSIRTVSSFGSCYSATIPTFTQIEPCNRMDRIFTILPAIFRTHLPTQHIWTGVHILSITSGVGKTASQHVNHTHLNCLRCLG